MPSTLLTHRTTPPVSLHVAHVQVFVLVSMVSTASSSPMWKGHVPVSIVPLLVSVIPLALASLSRETDVSILAMSSGETRGMSV